MPKNRENKPIGLAGMRKFGCSTDGQYVVFGFEDQKGKQHLYQCPHEVVGDIIGSFEVAAELAWQKRGSPDEVHMPKGTKVKSVARKVTGHRIQIGKDGIVLAAVCGPVIHETLWSPDECTQISEALAAAREEWQKRFRAN